MSRLQQQQQQKQHHHPPPPPPPPLQVLLSNGMTTRDSSNNNNDEEEDPDDSTRSARMILDPDYEDAHLILSVVPGQFNRKKSRVMMNRSTTSSSSSSQRLLMLTHLSASPPLLPTTTIPAVVHHHHHPKNNKTAMPGTVGTPAAVAAGEGRPSLLTVRRNVPLLMFNPWQEKSFKISSSSNNNARRGKQARPLYISQSSQQSLTHACDEDEDKEEDVDVDDADYHVMTLEQQEAMLALQKKMRAQKGLRGLFHKVKTIVGVRKSGSGSHKNKRLMTL
jgi:hypothetical protein